MHKKHHHCSKGSRGRPFDRTPGNDSGPNTVLGGTHLGRCLAQTILLGAELEG